MKLTLLICIVLFLAVASATKKEKKPYFKNVKPAEEVVQQWDCKRVETINLRAKETRANGNKCSYLWFIYKEIEAQYTVPGYPSCYAQLDGKCDSHVVDWQEKRNIRKFSIDLQLYCTGQGVEGAWEQVQNLLDAEKEKFADAFSTDYWACVEETIAPWIEAQYETMRPFPEPFLDVLNYVCQGVESQLKNADRIAFNQWFEASGNFTSITSFGKELFLDIQDQFNASGLDEEIVDCFAAEAGFFARAAIPQLDGHQSSYTYSGTGFEMAYIEFDEPLEGLNADESVWNDDEEGYECWMYYAPPKHYHESMDDVSENAFDGNRGHPLCGENTLYIPLSNYGPICCPIHDTEQKPYTYDCCSESTDLDQNRRSPPKIKLMKSKKECFGCYCLEGYTMDINGDYWGQDMASGACVKDGFEDDGEE